MPEFDIENKKEKPVYTPIQWLADIWGMPGMDGFFRYPVQTLYFYYPSPYKNRELALRYSYRIQYNKSKLPVKIYKFKHNWHSRGGGMLVNKFLFRYKRSKRILILTDRKGVRQFRTIVSLKKLPGNKSKNYSGKNPTPLALPIEKLGSILKKILDKSPVYLEKKILGFYSQLIQNQYFFYPGKNLSYKNYLFRSEKPFYIRNSKVETFWRDIRRPLVSVTLSDRRFRKNGRYLLYRWEQNYLEGDTPKKRLKSRKNYDNEMEKREKNRERIDFSREESRDIEISPLYAIIEYSENYPVKINIESEHGDYHQGWDLSYFEEMPAQESYLHPYYYTEDGLDQKDKKTTTSQKDQGGKIEKNKNIFPPIDADKGNLWGLEYLIRKIISSQLDGFLFPWPLKCNLPKEAIQKDESGKVLTKVLFEYDRRK